MKTMPSPWPQQPWRTWKRPAPSTLERVPSLIREGRQFLDGALARGWDSNFGAVANVQATYSAVRLAQAVLEKSDHAFLVGEGADALARAEELPPLPAPNDALKRVHEEAQEREKEKEKLGTFSFGGETDTVGAVALDAKGRLAAAGSTGGTWLKTPGRVGDTPVWGCGFYADPHRAVCATGVGELLMRGMASIRVANLCEAGLNPKMPQKNCARTGRRLRRRFGWIYCNRRTGPVGFWHEHQGHGAGPLATGR